MDSRSGSDLQAVPEPSGPRHLDAQRLYRLVDVGRSLMATLEFEDILGRVVEVAREITGARYGALGVFDEHRTELSRFVYRGIDDETAFAIGDLPHGRGVLGVLMEDPAPLRVDDIGQHPSSYGFPLNHPPMRSFLGAPISVRGQAWGNIYLTDKVGADGFDAGDEEAVVILADWAALAIGNARRYERVRGRRDELERAVSTLEATTMISSVLGGTTDLDRVLELVVKRARALIDARSVAIYLQDGDEMAVAHAAGELAADAVGQRVPVDSTVLGNVLRTRRATHVGELGQRAALVPAEGSGGSGALLVPLDFRGRAYGVLAAFDPAQRREFSSEDERLLVAFATSAASALATARSFEQGLLHRTIEAYEQERRRWAVDLEEGTMQQLRALRATLSQAREAAAHDELERTCDDVLGKLDREIDRLAWTITDLRPAELDELGLEAALRGLFARAEVEGFRVQASLSLEHEPGSPAARLTAPIEETVYRVVQEALENALRHADASSVEVTVDELGGQLNVVIRDRGRGYDATIVGEGIGIASMRERLAFLGGTLTVTSQPGAGTTVAARLPVRHRPAPGLELSA